MNESILIGQGDQISSTPRSHWEHHLAHVPEHGKQRLRFMSRNHHLVRNQVVTRLPILGQPIPATDISADLGLSLEEVEEILEELERDLFFLVRNQHGAVSWAFPVTVEPTPHLLTFDSGEQLYAA